MFGIWCSQLFALVFLWNKFGKLRAMWHLPYFPLSKSYKERKTRNSKIGRGPPFFLRILLGHAALGFSHSLFLGKKSGKLKAMCCQCRKERESRNLEIGVSVVWNQHIPCPGYTLLGINVYLVQVLAFRTILPKQKTRTIFPTEIEKRKKDRELGNWP